MINLDLFSYSIFNSYIVFSKKENIIHIRNIIDGDEDFSTICTIDLQKNNIQSVECEIDELRLIGKDQLITINYLDTDTFVIDANQELILDFAPRKYEFASKISSNIWNINLYSKKSKMLIVTTGELQVSQEWNVISSDYLDITLPAGTSKIAVSSDNFKESDYTLDNVNQPVKSSSDFKTFWNIESIDYTSSMFEAMYIIWSGFVKATGNLKYDACYMSKNIMTNIWSWDNCFVALALAKEQPSRAYEQFMSFYHVQSPFGNLPDFMNPHYVSYDFTKPPIQGVLYKELMNIDYEYFTDHRRLVSVLNSFKRLISYWSEYRTFGGIHKLPFNTHGNDTGLDNATVFEDAVEIRTPDLFVYLIKLIELVNEIETILSVEKTDYKEITDLYLHELTQVMYDGQKFNSYNVHNQEINEDSKCIIELIPLLIAEHFDNDTQQSLVANVQNFLTDYGLASESPTSKFYKQDGYWRGPIWAPTTCLCYLGLVNSGQLEIAKQVKNSYMKMCEEYGFAENFDALAGTGLSDKSFAWTAAVYKFLKEKDD
ncbi:trehalase family glycosidase [Mollicutes bacterium LVI A0039]|nr:trehalase family glycosidase [Mollicutes bacterium LVI A0039]